MAKLNDFRSTIVRDVDGKEVEFGSFLPSSADGTPVLIVFLRRFGCVLCRWQASKIAKMADAFKEKGVRLVAIAPEQLGIEQFLEGKYWKGEVYYDERKALYVGLGLGRAGLMETLGSIFQKSLRQAAHNAGQDGISGNFSGDGQQLGGCFLVDKDGTVIYEWRQKEFTDEMDLKTIASKAAIDYSNPTDGEKAPECSTECALPATTSK